MLFLEKNKAHVYVRRLVGEHGPVLWPLVPWPLLAWEAMRVRLEKEGKQLLPCSFPWWREGGKVASRSLAGKTE